MEAALLLDQALGLARTDPWRCDFLEKHFPDGGEMHQEDGQPPDSSLQPAVSPHTQAGQAHPPAPLGVSGAQQPVRVPSGSPHVPGLVPMPLPIATRQLFNTLEPVPKP